MILYPCFFRTLVSRKDLDNFSSVLDNILLVRKDWNGQVFAMANEIGKIEHRLKQYNGTSFERISEELEQFKQDVHEMKQDMAFLKNKLFKDLWAKC